MEMNPKAERWPSRLEPARGIALLGTARRNFFEPLCEMRLVEGLVTFGGPLRDHVIAEKLMIAEDVLGRLLIVVGRPGSSIFFEIGRSCVGEIPRTRGLRRRLTEAGRQDRRTDR